VIFSRRNSAAGSTATATRASGSARLSWPVPDDNVWAKLCRDSSVAGFSHDGPPSQPLTLGGANRDCPTDPLLLTTDCGDTNPWPTALTAPRTYSTGPLIRWR